MGVVVGACRGYPLLKEGRWDMKDVLVGIVLGFGMIGCLIGMCVGVYGLIIAILK